MAHPQQIEYCSKIRDKFPEHFKNKRVLDCGSLDINGNNRYLFTDCDYTGIDLGKGKNVDVVSRIHEYKAEKFDTIISTECFEHDRYYKQSLNNIFRLLKAGGLFLFTCATTGRKEHGTHIKPEDAPYTNDYYKNLTEQDIRKAIDLSLFSEYEFEVNELAKDLYFYGIK